MRRNLLLAMAVIVAVAGFSARTAFAVTADEVDRAIEKAKEHLITMQGPDGLWPEGNSKTAGPYGHSEMALFTLAYLGADPKKPVIEKGLTALLSRTEEHTYAVSLRTMALAYIQKSLKTDPRRDLVHEALKVDATWLVSAQGGHGGWDYKTLNGTQGRYDFSNTQMAILALREAALAGIEVPEIVWKRSQDLYVKLHQQDGSWNYGEHNKSIGNSTPGYGSMTAAGLASLFITIDFLDLNSGCPCRGSVSNKSRTNLDRHLDSALQWLSNEFTVTDNPKFPQQSNKWHLYWLYAAERVGIASGYKYFGTHDWYKEGAEFLVKRQQPTGGWGDIPDTCFATLYLYKGRAPILFNKLQHAGEWNNHRRDIANMVAFAEKQKEQPFRWQIVSLQAPLEDLHEAPILYITTETPGAASDPKGKEPIFSDEDKKKLREFTDTGGTIFLEASCGNPAVRKWVPQFVKEVWPEWSLKPLGSDHGLFTDPNTLRQRPEILAANDGLRPFLFYAMDDISCYWQTKAYTSKEYLFKFGINLFTVATDHSPLRAALATAADTVKTPRYTTPVKPGPRSAFRMARLKYDGTWNVGRNYKAFAKLAPELMNRAHIEVQVNDDGLSATELSDQQAAAYLVGSSDTIALSDAEREALKTWLGKGGFLWAEAAGGSMAFDQAFKKLAADMGLELKMLDKTSPLMSGKFKRGAGYDLTNNVQFRRALRVRRLGRPYAELTGIYQAGKLVGVYSPFDVVFSTTTYDAYACLGYQPEDAVAVATNIAVYLTDREGAN